MQLRFSTGEGYLNFSKKILLEYPQLSQSDTLELYVPDSPPEPKQFARFVASTTPNVIVVENGIKRPCDVPTPTSIIEATQRLLRMNGVVNPFDSGFVFPKLINLDLENDLHISNERFAELQIIAFKKHFCAHNYSKNELLVVLFVLFKHLLKSVPKSFQKTDSELWYFLLVCRVMYKSHLPFHTFWHCVDVTQFSVYLMENYEQPSECMLDSCEKLALALAALGHDMLHNGLMTPALCMWDLSFEKRYDSLEEFHSKIFRSLLKQLWPEMLPYWHSIIQRGILATELSNHENYLVCGFHSRDFFLHILKMSDFASAARFLKDDYDKTSKLIFEEISAQVRICAPLGNSVCGFSLKQSQSELQRSFLSQLVIPYFQWLVEQAPVLESFLNSARGHLTRYEEVKKVEESHCKTPSNISIT